MVPAEVGRLFSLLMRSSVFVHPFALDVLIGVVYVVAIGLALSALRSGNR
jgi:hypothetical protein